MFKSYSESPPEGASKTCCVCSNKKHQLFESEQVQENLKGGEGESKATVFTI